MLLDESGLSAAEKWQIVARPHFCGSRQNTRWAFV